jgi:hypothetical protein
MRRPIPAKWIEPHRRAPTANPSIPTKRRNHPRRSREPRSSIPAQINLLASQPTLTQQLLNTSPDRKKPARIQKQPPTLNRLNPTSIRPPLHRDLHRRSHPRTKPMFGRRPRQRRSRTNRPPSIAFTRNHPEPLEQNFLRHHDRRMIQLPGLTTPSHDPFPNHRQIAKQIVALKSVANQILRRPAQHDQRHPRPTRRFERNPVSRMCQQVTAAPSRHPVTSNKHVF